jgi:hypothetical protein
MIQNFRIFYIHYPLITADIQSFEDLFWKIYKEELPKYFRTVTEHIKASRQTGKHNIVRKAPLKKYNK